jgi:hypothetical protein
LGVYVFEIARESGIVEVGVEAGSSEVSPWVVVGHALWWVRPQHVVSWSCVRSVRVRDLTVSRIPGSSCGRRRGNSISVDVVSASVSFAISPIEWPVAVTVTEWVADIVVSSVWDIIPHDFGSIVGSEK